MSSQSTFLGDFLRVSPHPITHRYSTCSKSQSFLEWHSSARFPASRRLSYVSLVMPLTSLLMARFSYVCQVLRITLQISTSSQPQGHRLVCYELQRELQWHDDDRDNRELHQHLEQLSGGARSDRWSGKQLASEAAEAVRITAETFVPCLTPT